MTEQSAAPGAAPPDAAASGAEEHAAERFVSRERSVVERLQHLLHARAILAPALVLAAAFLAFALLNGARFAAPGNFSLIVQQVMIIGTLGIAQTLIVLTAGIDLSVGAIMVLASVVMGKLAVELGVPAPLALLIGFSVGALCGLLNGLLVTRLRLPPFIATLGTLSIFFAINLAYSASETIRSQDVRAIAPQLQFHGNTLELFGTSITYGSIFMVVLFAIAWYGLNWTSWGRHVYAVGDDREAARLAGIRSDRVLLSVYIIGGVICALAGWMLIGRIGSVSPQAGQTANLDSITAVVIGGTSLFGGRGNIFGTLVGALTVGVFRNGLALAGVDVLWQDFTVGALIIAAVATDQWIRRVRA